MHLFIHAAADFEGFKDEWSAHLMPTVNTAELMATAGSKPGTGSNACFTTVCVSPLRIQKLYSIRTAQTID